MGELPHPAQHQPTESHSVALDELPDALLIIDEPGRIVACNQASLDLFGYAQQGLRGRLISDLVLAQADQRGHHRDASAPSLFKAMNRALRKGSGKSLSSAVELLGKHHDGHHFALDVSVSASGSADNPRQIWVLRDISKHLHSNARLKRAALIIENSPVVLFRWLNQEGWPVEMVSQNVESLGYRAADLMSGKIAFEQMVHPDDLARVGQEVQHYVAEGIDRFEQEYRIVAPDGSVRWIDDRTLVERDSYGNITHFQGIVVDITDRKKAEYELEAALEMQRVLNAMLHLSLPSLTLDELLQYALSTVVSAEFLLSHSQGAIFTFEARDLTLAPTLSAAVLAPGESPQHSELLELGRALAIAAQQTQTLQFIQVDAQDLATTGSAQRPALSAIYALPILQDDHALGALLLGLPTGQDRSAILDEYVLMVADTLSALITRKHTEAELRQLAEAVKQSPESIVITDRHLRIQYVNEAFEQSSGYRLEEILGANPNILRTAETPQETYQHLWASLQNGLPWKGEFYNQRKDGSRYVEFAHIAPIRQPGGEISHYVGVKEDITERKKLARELDRHRHHLEDLVEERTRELRLAQQKSEAANQAKSSFLANMSHEIRTPMNAILGLTHLIQNDDLSAEQAERMGKISDSANHLLAVINDILDISKIEAGKLELETSDFSIESIFQQVETLIRDQAQAKGIEVTTQFDSVPDWLQGDPTRLRQALLNYAANAVKFTSAGRVQMNGILLQQQGDMALIRFEVIDTGIGIDADKLGHLFNAFEQADSSFTRRYGGTGLGLAITRHIAEWMGGEVGVTSEVGKGSCFWFTANLRLGEESAQSEEDANNTMLVQSLVPSTRLLLVEDNPINREVAVEMLRGYGVQVDVADNGRVAVIRAQNTTYDLILMDLQMPEMNGIDATHEIRKLAGYQQVPILAMTANVFAEDRQSSLAAGMDDFMIKPVDPAELHAILLKWLPHKTVLTSVDDEDTGTIQLPPVKLPDDDPLGQWVARQSVLRSRAPLARLNGDADAYTRLLLQFERLHGEDVAALQQLLKNNFRQKALELTHSIKGSAATLGLSELSQQAEQLEQLLHNSLSRSLSSQSPLRSRSEAQPDSTHDSLHELATACNAEQTQLLDAMALSFKDLRALLQTLPTAPDSEASIGVVSEQEALQTLQTIEQLLQHDDAEVNQLVRKTAPMLDQAYGDHSKQLRDLIEGFDYPMALEKVRTLMVQGHA